MIQQLSNSTIIRDVPGLLQITDLGNGLGAVTRTLVRGAPAANQAALADIILADNTGAVATVLRLPQMPVGSVITFILGMDDAGASFEIQELATDGVTFDRVATRNAVAANLAFASVAAPSTVGGADVPAAFTGLLTNVGGTAASSWVLQLTKIREGSGAAISDGWIVTSFSRQSA